MWLFIAASKKTAGHSLDRNVWMFFCVVIFFYLMTPETAWGWIQAGTSVTAVSETSVYPNCVKASNLQYCLWERMCSSVINVFILSMKELKQIDILLIFASNCETNAPLLASTDQFIVKVVSLNIKLHWYRGNVFFVSLINHKAVSDLNLLICMTNKH